MSERVSMVVLPEQSVQQVNPVHFSHGLLALATLLQILSAVVLMNCSWMVIVL